MTVAIQVLIFIVGLIAAGGTGYLIGYDKGWSNCIVWSLRGQLGSRK